MVDEDRRTVRRIAGGVLAIVGLGAALVAFLHLGFLPLVPMLEARAIDARLGWLAFAVTSVCGFGSAFLLNRE